MRLEALLARISAPVSLGSWYVLLARSNNINELFQILRDGGAAVAKVSRGRIPSNPTLPAINFRITRSSDLQHSQYRFLSDTIHMCSNGRRPASLGHRIGVLKLTEVTDAIVSSVRLIYV